ncbi:unnamed protein product [Arctogadus glacialis]
MEVTSSFLSSTPSFSTSTSTLTYSSTSTITYSSTFAYSSPVTYSSTSIITHSSTIASSSIRPDRISGPQGPPATLGLIPDIPEGARDCLPDPCGRPWNAAAFRAAAGPRPPAEDRSNNKTRQQRPSVTQRSGSTAESDSHRKGMLPPTPSLPPPPPPPSLTHARGGTTPFSLHGTPPTTTSNVLRYGPE